MNFTHLHVHSHYSMLDGMSKVKDLVKKAKKNGMTAMALTDHGNMFGIKDFVDTVEKENGDINSQIKKQKENSGVKQGGEFNVVKSENNISHEQPADKQ